MAANGETAAWLAGPMFLGCTFSYFLYGVSFTQTVHYFRTTPLSKRFAYGITLVTAVSLFELGHVITITCTVVHILVISIPKGDLSFRSPPISLAIAPLTTAVHVLVQGHFALRIRKFSGYSLIGTAITLLIFILGLIQLTASIIIAYTTAKISRDLTRLVLSRAQTNARMVWFVNNVVADVIITCSLVFLYLKFRKNTERRASRSWLNTLIRHTIENGAVTCVFATIHIIFYLAMPQNLIYLGFAYFNARLSSNVLLASLNASRQIQIEGGTDSDIDFSSAISSTEKGPSGATVRHRSPVARRRHSLSGAIQNARFAASGTRTNDFQLTTLDSSMMHRSRSGLGEVQQTMEGHSNWSVGDLNKR
ncbi:hypothetical protein DFP72DRAFT_901412 [Ephemerocybe angulata]|uniref:DUF6534 domain-containing protein n=1 Tax=Ephemerocybe angulata TaxID=980116 RepID=A0A8H6HV32_9AGAR|nr:hypothetical protein DFP72DRAFT_901412 [Tulosesus angulatus]